MMRFGLSGADAEADGESVEKGDLCDVTADAGSEKAGAGMAVVEVVGGALLLASKGCGSGG